MLECEGYKMFYGTATVTPKNPKFPPSTLTGTWLYKPEYDCWYVDGQSYMAEIVSDIHEVNPVSVPRKKNKSANLMSDDFLEEANFEL